MREGVSIIIVILVVILVLFAIGVIVYLAYKRSHFTCFKNDSIVPVGIKFDPVHSWNASHGVHHGPIIPAVERAKMARYRAKSKLDIEAVMNMESSEREASKRKGEIVSDMKTDLVRVAACDERTAEDSGKVNIDTPERLRISTSNLLQRISGLTLNSSGTIKNCDDEEMALKARLAIERVGADR